MHTIFEIFIASNESSYPKPKPLPSLLHSEPFVFPSKQPTQVKCWNQANFGYFDPHLNEKTHGPGKVVLVGKDVYYRNVILFVQRIQNLVTLKEAAFVRSNIPISLRGSALK